MKRIIRPTLAIIAATTIWAGDQRAAASDQTAPSTPSSGILLEGTVVTMNDHRDVLTHGHVLVRDGVIAAVWDGPDGPASVDLAGVTRVLLGPDALIYPGLINLHDHPFYGALPLWSPPSSHVQASLGRPAGTEPYANRY